MIIYQHFSETITLFPNEKINTYGIQAVENGKILSSVSNVTTIQSHAKTLAEICTFNELDPIHLSDIIDDFILYEFENTENSHKKYQKIKISDSILQRSLI